MPSSSQSTLRERNLALVVRTVCAAAGPLSRADVAAATSLTRSTVSRLVGAGLALPGIVSADSGRLLLAPNLGWADVDARALLGPAAVGGLTLRVGNEADLAARTIASPAPGRPGHLADFLYVSGEIGIGGAAVVDGRVMGGRHGWAGEIGHVCVDPTGPTCGCGSTG